ncbi:hypothetical protein [Parvularcula dongshanensis]|uniref:Sulfotransferase family protein n=1 Tax=Parvularcula dongshanensis TaxID=1173995 RepID=A0A840I2G2_9PROT|nr:hypothetical protein [Parvularcula dongshanensis]MBB4659019.1 hypothetical protein [Parvularcula dongshanensis]
MIDNLKHVVERWRPSDKDARETVHFLHIGKNAGTQIGDLVNQNPQEAHRPRVLVRDHDVRLRDLPTEDRYFFSIRRPAERFYSGFYSRKRCGRPRYDYPWSPYEAAAFAEFEHANELAESLFDAGPRGRQAVAAIKSIQHTSTNQLDWFDRHGTFLEVRPPVFIVRTERFDTDVRELLDRLGYADLPVGGSRAHGNDYSGTPPLSERGRENLERWYVQDAAFYDLCEAWIEAELGKRGARGAGRAGRASPLTI